MIYTVRQWESEQDPSTPVAATPPSLRTGKMEGRTRMWKVATNGSSPARQITFGEKGDSQPQWSPDGKQISFVSSRGSAEAKSQIYLMHADGGEAWKLTDAKENVSAYSWSPDSTRIAYVTTDPRSSDEEANIKKRDDERVFEGDFRYQHAWVVEVNTRQATRITEGTSYTLQGAPSWSPDGKRFVFGGRHADAARQPRTSTWPVRHQQVDKTHEWAAMSPRWSWTPHHRVGDRTECHDAAAGRHRVERGPPGPPGPV